MSLVNENICNVTIEILYEKSSKELTLHQQSRMQPLSTMQIVKRQWHVPARGGPANTAGEKHIRNMLYALITFLFPTRYRMIGTQDPDAAPTQKPQPTAYNARPVKPVASGHKNVLIAMPSQEDW